MHRVFHRDRREKGFSLLELLVTVAIIGVISMIAIPIYINALRSSHRAALVGEANGVFKAFMRYNVDNSAFPTTASFDLLTLEPLVSEGYLSDGMPVVQKLHNQTVTAYAAPTAGGANAQFWAVLTLGYDPDVQVLVASTDQFPGHSGDWYEGLYYIQGSELVRVP
jgi:prepilin-type N-terminal cleavage/methylation domain-containing protein